MRWKLDDETLLLVLVLAPESSWIILCDHNKLLHHQFWAFSGLVSRWALSPSCGHPLLVAPTLGCPSLHKNSVATAVYGWVCLVLVFYQETKIDHCNCGDKSFYCDTGPLFLFSSTVAISPFEPSA
jgi:hypothetical protein